MSESNGLRAALESLGGFLKDWTVLAPQTDPFRMDTPTNHRDAAWLADTMDSLGITGKIHNRGLHYALLTQPLPCGDPYTVADWAWLEGVSNVARWLGYVPFDRVTDERNAEPVLRLWKPPQPLGYVSTDFGVYLPDADDLTPRAMLEEFTGTQPYHLAPIGEKSSLDGVLGPIADEYQADLYLPTGNISNTRIHELAASAAADGRPLVTLYFSDCDPSGWHMPIEVARKLQALRVQLYPQLQFRCQRVGLTPDQVCEYGLPISPVTETDKRAAKWEKAMRVQQTEIDALATLQPDLLRRIAIDAITHFYDHGLAARVAAARQDWQRRAQAACDEQTDAVARADALASIERKRAEIDAILDTVRVDADRFDLPELPDIPQGVQLNGQPEPLCDSNWSFAEQTRRLIASKNYNNDEVGARP
jgi:hypothetical protein